MAVNETYYIIQRTRNVEEIDYLNSIFQQTVSFAEDYAQAIRFEDTATADAFIDFCNANSSWDVAPMQVTLTIQPVSE